MTDPQIPRLSTLVEPGVTALVQARPSAAPHIPKGRYGDVVAGWRAQAALLRRQLADEAAAARLGTATLDELVELAASEFWAQVDPSPANAVGHAIVQRSVTTGASATSGNFGLSGVIPAGTRFSRPARGAAGGEFSYAAAEYESTEPVAVDDVDTATTAVAGGYLHNQALTIPVRASAVGPDPNCPFPVVNAVMADEAFDSRIACTQLTAGGGTMGPGVEKLVALAKAMWSGKHGPTNGALVAGALSYPGIARAQLVLNTGTAIARVWIADESWAGSLELSDSVQQQLLDKWAGWGARVSVRAVTNVVVGARVAVVMEPRYQGHLAAVKEAVTGAMRAHLDGPTWWTWNLNTLGGLVSRCHPRILSCKSVAITSTTGATYVAPSTALSSTYCPHFMLNGSAVDVTVESPS